MIHKKDKKLMYDASNNIIKILILMIIQEKFEKQYKSCRLDILDVYKPYRSYILNEILKILI